VCVPEDGAPNVAPLEVAAVHRRLEEVRVMAELHRHVPLQRMPHVHLHLHCRPPLAWMTDRHGRQLAQAKASPDPDGLQRRGEHFHLAYLLQIRQVAQVDCGQLGEPYSACCMIHPFFQHEDVPEEVAAVDDVDRLQVGECVVVKHQ
jgi:hypothetical protein